jgi:hypothetical protein
MPTAAGKRDDDKSVIEQRSGIDLGRREFSNPSNRRERTAPMQKSLHNRILVAAGTLALALPSLALAQADQSQTSPSQTSQDQTGQAQTSQPAASPTSSDAAQASAAPMNNTAGAATSDTTGSGSYPPCSATVTDHCMQHEGRTHHRAHHRAR